MIVAFVEEYKLNEQDKIQLKELLFACFNEEAFLHRVYYKQRAQSRLLLKENGKIIAQLALDYRVMKLGSEAIQVLGIIDFAVVPSLQGKGLGTQLLQELDRLALNYQNNIDFILLAADTPTIYLKNGFRTVKQQVKWLGINEHETVGVLEQELDCFLIKALGQKEWDETATLDMLGYLY